jgi:hypothetical protein
VIGRLKAGTGGAWSGTVAGDIVGSGGGSDNAWQALVTVDPTR